MSVGLIDSAMGYMADYFGKPFLVREISVPYSVGSAGQYNTNLKPLVDADLPSGYKCAGIVGYATADVRLYFVSCYYQSHNYSFQIKNTSSSSISGNAKIFYLAVPA